MPLPNDQLEEIILKWMKGNASAAAFLSNIAAMARLADNLVDGDSLDRSEDMANLLVRAIAVNSSNRFYREHSEKLLPVIVHAILMWQMSEEWKASSNEKTRMFAFVYREGVEHILFLAAQIVGGASHAKQVMAELHELSHQSSPETFADWEKENGNVRQ